jgi:hypothetical protein
MLGPHLEGDEVRKPPHRVIQEDEDPQKERDLGREPYSPPGRLEAGLQRHVRFLS